MPTEIVSRNLYLGVLGWVKNSAWIRVWTRLQFTKSYGILFNQRELQFPEGLEMATVALHPNYHLPVSATACEIIQIFPKLRPECNT